MKVLLVLIVLGALALAAAYYFGGFRTMDPTQQATNFKAKIQPGMTWEQVVAIGKPQKFVGLWVDGLKIGRQAPRNLDAAQLKAALAANQYPEGFIFQHIFSARDAWEVNFDATGKVASVEKMLTTQDILEGKLVY